MFHSVRRILQVDKKSKGIDTLDVNRASSLVNIWRYGLKFATKARFRVVE